MIKFTCVNSEKAEIAKCKLSKLGLNARVIDRTILASGDYTNSVIKIMCDALAHTESPNEWDMRQL